MKKEIRILKRQTDVKNLSNDFDNIPEVDISDRLKNPSKYIVLPKKSLDIKLMLPSFRKMNGDFMSFNDVSDLVGNLLVPVTKVDERFKIVRWRFEGDEEISFINQLEKEGLKNITKDLKDMNFDKMEGNEFFLVNENDLDVIRNIKTFYTELFNEI